MEVPAPARDSVAVGAPRSLAISPGRGEGEAWFEALAAARELGPDAVQIREPALAPRELLRWAERLRSLFDAGRTKVLVNDRVDLAADELLDGVHLGWRSLPSLDARALLGPGKWIGRSLHDAEEVELEAGIGALDYATFGPLFETPSKQGLLEPRGLEELARAAARAPLPLLALGGVGAQHLPALRQAGARGFAGISAFSSVSSARAILTAAAEVFA